MKMRLLAVLLMVAVTCPLLGTVAAFAEGSPTVVDVALGERGVMSGQVVDVQGVAAGGQQVLLTQGAREIAVTATNSEGYFSVEGVRGGVYQLITGDSIVVLRAWAPGTAPPVAQRGVLLVAGQDVYRGQQAVRSARNFMAHPVTVVGVVATGIAVPIALHHSRRRSPASPD